MLSCKIKFKISTSVKIKLIVFQVPLTYESQSERMLVFCFTRDLKILEFLELE